MDRQSGAGIVIPKMNKNRSLHFETVSFSFMRLNNALKRTLVVIVTFYLNIYRFFLNDNKFKNSNRYCDYFFFKYEIFDYSMFFSYENVIFLIFI